jgi:hypothetical protein
MNDFPSRSVPAAEQAWAGPTRARGASDVQPQRRWVRWLLGLFAGVLLLNLALMLHWGRQPPGFDVAASARAELSTAGGQAVPGTTMTTAMITLGETLLGKPGGFLHNDRLPPGVLMDNMPGWECGVVMALRDAVQALRDDFTRAKSQSIENLDVKRADMKLAMDPKAWMLPAAEDAYREGIDALRAYLADLAGGRARFYPRADNLGRYLALVEKRLGNFGVRLGAAAGASLGSSAEPGGGGDGARSGLGGAALGAADLSAGPVPLEEAFDPARVDDVFFCSRGYSWALLHLLRAAQVDFGPVLADKNAVAPVQRIVQDLEGAIKPMRSPVVLNGGGFGLLANHSLVAASYVARVNAAVIDLRLLLEQG